MGELAKDGKKCFNAVPREIRKRQREHMPFYESYPPFWVLAGWLASWNTYLLDLILVDDDDDDDSGLDKIITSHS